MKLNIDICTDSRCKVYVTDKTEASASSGYLPEDNVSYAKNRFRYSDSMSIEVIQLERYNEDGVNVNSTSFYEHTKENRKNGYELPINFDGVFNVHSIVIPTNEWFINTLQNMPEALDIYDVIYVGDYDEKVIYKYIKKNTVAKSIDDWNKEAADVGELIERNPDGTTISSDCSTYVSICYLTNCYLSLCQAIFEGKGFSGRCFSRSNIDQETLFRRDMVWMAINVIKYLVEFERLHEAQRIIEQIGGCNGLCKGWYERDGIKPDCGCGR